VLERPDEAQHEHAADVHRDALHPGRQAKRKSERMMVKSGFIHPRSKWITEPGR
jgi:hypothetical protein